MPEFQPGDGVRLLFDVVSDGTVYGVPRGAPLLAAGALGYIVREGVALLEETIYDVHFVDADRIVGCREKELIPMEAHWEAPRFRKGERVTAVVDLMQDGTLIAEAGTPGTVGPLLYHAAHGYVYETAFDGAACLCLVTPKQLAKTE